MSTTSWRLHPALSVLVLLVVYGALSFALDHRGYLGTDTGGKVATLEVMAANGTFDPDVGYWAEAWDPEGSFHPLWYTTRFEGRWVQATTLPMQLAAQPLYRLGGYRLALLLPMLGSLVAALAAAALVRRVTGQSGELAFWLVGLASPMLIYALDFWEHSLGVGLMAWGVVVLVDYLDRPALWRPAVAGLLFAAAATMRTEALVYGFVAVGLACALLLARRRSALLAVAGGGVAAVAVSVPLVANFLLERATLGEPFRSDRAAGTAGRFADDGVSRLLEGGLTAAAPYPSLAAQFVLIGLALVAFMVVVAVWSDDPERSRLAMVGLGGVGLLYLIRFTDGLGFVPGMLIAAPLGVVGLVHGWRHPPARFPLAVALIALPIVWSFQFTGGAAPQWGGRYVLTSGLLLGAVGIACLPRLAPWARHGFVAIAVAVTAFGFAWMAERSHGVARFHEEIAARDEPVVISRIHHLAREGGAFHLEQRWLTAIGQESVDAAAEVVEAAGHDRFVVVDLAGRTPTEPPPGFVEIGEDRADFIGVEMRVQTFERD